MFKLRFGIHLMGKTRLTEDDPKCGCKKPQNKLARFITKSKISDRINTEELLKNVTCCQ